MVLLLGWKLLHDSAAGAGADFMAGTVGGSRKDRNTLALFGSDGHEFKGFKSQVTMDFFTGFLRG